MKTFASAILCSSLSLLAAEPHPPLNEGAAGVKVMEAASSSEIEIDDSVIQAYQSFGPQRSFLKITQKDGRRSLSVPQSISGDDVKVTLESAVASVLEKNGRVVFLGQGEAKKGNQTFEYVPTNWGKYDVEAAYTLAGTSDAAFEVELAGETLTKDLAPTGPDTTLTSIIGRLYIADDRKPLQLKVTHPGIRLHAITLRPAPEGDRDVITEDEPGRVTLKAEEATVYGIKLRYEPQPKKLCVGYWVHPEDHATWHFTVSEPGEYTATILQGCGPGEAGSTAFLQIGDEAREFTVKETGGFQDFQAVEVGTFMLNAGPHKLTAGARNKTNVAVMDIKSITLQKK